VNKTKIITELARMAGYNEPVKAQYKKLALQFLRTIAKDLQLAKDDYQIRFNPGGIAVSGDATLHHKQFYLAFGDYGAYWRTCNGLRDYSGGANRWFAGFAEVSRENLVKEIQSVLTNQTP